MIPWFISEDSGESLPAAAADWFADGAIPDTWALARSAAALGRNSAGRWTSYATNVPRPYHDPQTLTYRGILIEPERTQLVPRSRSSAGLVGVTANASTISTDAAIQTPFGLGCTKIVPTTTNAQHGYNFSFGTALADNSTVSFATYLKPIGAYRRGEIFLLSKANVYSGVAFTMEGTGTVISSSGAVTNASITPDVDGFFLLKWTMAYGVGTTATNCNVLVEPDTGARTHIGDGTSGFHLCYFGAEIGFESTSPILSDGTVNVIRPADTLTAAAALVSIPRKSIGIQYTPLSQAGQTIIHAGATDAVDLRNSGQTITYLATTGGEVVALLNGAAPVPGIERTVIVTAALNEFRLAQNGTLIGTDPAGHAPMAFETWRIGAGADGAGAGPMLLKRLKLWNQPLDADASEAFSADLSIEGETVVQPIVEIQPTYTVTPSQTVVTLLVSSVDLLSGARVGWRTIDGTALGGQDYVTDSGTAIIPPGETTAEITVNLSARSASEDRTFVIELLNPVDATIGNARCVVTLLRLVQQGIPATVQSVFGATLPAEWTVTRATAARTRNSDGIWVAVLANVHRHHYVAPGISGILVQAATSEQRLYDSVDPGWTVVGSTKTLDTTTQTMVGTRSLNWRMDASTGDHRLSVTLTTANCDMPTGEFTLAAIVKPVGGVRYWVLSVKGIDNVVRKAVFDLTGAGAVATADTGTIVAAERDPFFTDFYNVTMNRSQAVTAGVSATIDIFPSDEFGNVLISGDTAQGIDIAHLQLEPFAGVGAPVVPAAGTTAKIVRVGDVLKATGAWFQRQSYTLGIRYIRLRDVPTTQRLLQTKDGVTVTTPDDNGLTIESGVLTARLRTGNANLSPIVGGTTTAGTLHTALLVVDHTGRIALFDSGTKRGEVAVGASGGASPVAPTVLRIGSTEPSGTAASNFLIQAVFLWNDPLGDADAALFSGNLNYSPPAGPVALPVLSVPAALSVKEGDAISIPVTKTGAGTCSINYRTRAVAPTTVGADYTGIEGTLSFLTGDASKTVTVQTLADAVAESPNETFRFEMLAGTEVGCTLGPAISTVTITETPRVDVGPDFSVQEGTAAVFNLTKIGTGACSVTVQTQQVTATVNVDYTGIPATVINFGATENSKTVTIQTTADAVTEASGETFRLNLTLPVNCTIGRATCTATISDTAVDPGTALAAPKGFGTTGDFGLAGSVYKVTSLADTNTQGTLRHALLTAGTAGRLIVFEVAGVIKTTARINVLKAYNVTVAGETAPSPGITIQSSTDFEGPLIVFYDCRNFNISNINFERHYADIFVRDTNFDGWGTEPRANESLENFWIDHCSTFWTFDEAASMWHGSTWSDATSAQQNITISNTMFCEALDRPDLVGGRNPHRKNGEASEPGHNYGLLIGYRVKRIDLQYCMFAEMKRRTPFLDVGAQAVLANNLALNCEKGPTAEHNERDGYQSLVTTVGYLVISGPNTEDTNISGFRIHGTYGTNHKFFASDLYGWKGAGATVTPKTVITLGKSSYSSMIVTTRPIDTPTPAVALTAQEIYDRACLNIGPRPKERAIPSVAKAIAKLVAKTGKWVNLPSEVGGPSSLTTKTRSLGTVGAGASPGNFPDGSPIPPIPTAGNATTMRAYIRKFKDQVQYD